MLAMEDGNKSAILLCLGCGWVLLPIVNNAGFIGETRCFVTPNMSGT